MVLGTLVPAVMLLNPGTRQHPFWRMTALALVVIGVVAYRWDTNLSGLAGGDALPARASRPFHTRRTRPR